MPILTHAGKISAKLAKEKADHEYDKFKERIKNNLSAVEIHFLENFEREQKRLLRDEKSAISTSILHNSHIISTIKAGR